MRIQENCCCSFWSCWQRKGRRRLFPMWEKGFLERKSETPLVWFRGTSSPVPTYSRVKEMRVWTVCICFCFYAAALNLETAAQGTAFVPVHRIWITADAAEATAGKSHGTEKGDALARIQGRNQGQGRNRCQGPSLRFRMDRYAAVKNNNKKWNVTVCFVMNEPGRRRPEAYEPKEHLLLLL